MDRAGRGRGERVVLIFVTIFAILSLEFTCQHGLHGGPLRVARLETARSYCVAEDASTGPARTESDSSQCTYTNFPSDVPCQPASVGEDGARPPSRARQRVARRCQTCTAHPLGGCEPASWPCAERSPAGKTRRPSVHTSQTRRVCCVCHRVGHQYTPRQRAVSHPVSLSFTFTAAATCRHHASAAHYRARRFPTTCASHHARSSVPKRTHCTHAPSQPWRRLPTVTDARCSASHAGAADASLRRCFHVHAASAASKSTRATCPSQKHLSSSRTSVQFAGSRSRATKRRCSNGVLGRRRENWNVLRPR